MKKILEIDNFFIRYFNFQMRTKLKTVILSILPKSFSILVTNSNKLRTQAKKKKMSESKRNLLRISFLDVSSEV